MKSAAEMSEVQARVNDPDLAWSAMTDQQPTRSEPPDCDRQSADASLAERAEHLISEYDAAVSNGDRTAAKTIIGGELSDLIQTALRWRIGYNLPDKGNGCVEDAQEKVVCAIVSPKTAKAAKAVRLYFGSFAIRRAQDALRKAGRAVDHAKTDRDFAGLLDPSTFSDPEKAYHTRLDLDRALERMPEDHRAYVLMLANGDKRVDIAKVLQVDERTLRNWHRTIKERYGLADYLLRS